MKGKQQYFEKTLAYFSDYKTITKEMLIRSCFEEIVTLTKRYPLYKNIKGKQNIKLDSFDTEVLENIKAISTRTYNNFDDLKVPFLMTFRFVLNDNVKKFKEIIKVLDDMPRFVRPTYLILNENGELIFIYKFQEYPLINSAKLLKEFATKLQRFSTVIKWKLFGGICFDENLGRFDNTICKRINFNENTRVFVLNETFKNYGVFADRMYSCLFTDDDGIERDFSKFDESIAPYFYHFASLSNNYFYIKDDCIFEKGSNEMKNMALNSIKNYEKQLLLTDTSDYLANNLYFLINTYKMAGVKRSQIRERIKELKKKIQENVEKLAKNGEISNITCSIILQELNVRTNYDYFIYEDVRKLTLNTIRSNSSFIIKGNKRDFGTTKEHLDAYKGKKKVYSSFFESQNVVDLILELYKNDINYKNFNKRIVRKIVKEKNVKITDKTINKYFKDIKAFFKQAKGKDFIQFFLENLKEKGSKTIINRFSRAYENVSLKDKDYEVINAKKTYYSRKNNYVRSSFYVFVNAVNKNIGSFFKSIKTMPKKLADGTYRFIKNGLEYLFSNDMLLLSIKKI